MSMVVDTCVIIDIYCGDPIFADKSAQVLDLKRNNGLIVAPISYVELAPSFKGDYEAQDEFLHNLGINVQFEGKRDVVIAAYNAWYEHITRKRMGKDVRRPIADVMIGAYALEKGGLITRNKEDFRSLYPTLKILNPTTTTI